MKDLAYALGKTKNQVMSRVQSLMRMGYLDRKTVDPHTPWSEEDETKLAELYPKTDISELVKLFGKSKRLIYMKVKSLRVSGVDIPLKVKKHKVWTEEEIEFIKKHYEEHSGSQIAKMLGLETSVVMSKINRLAAIGEMPRKGKGFKRKKGVDRK